MVLAGAVLSACGNTVQYPDQLRNSQALSLSPDSGSLSAARQCSDSVNIQSESGSINFEYRACHGSDTTSVKIFPENTQSQSVCVFAARSGQVLIANAAAPLASRFMVKCGSLSPSGTNVSFPGVAFDSIYVATSAQAITLAACIAYGDIASCANQSKINYASGSL